MMTATNQSIDVPVRKTITVKAETNFGIAILSLQEVLHICLSYISGKQKSPLAIDF